MLNRQLNLRKKDVDISALIHAVFEKLSHIEQSTMVGSILDQAVNILLNKGLDTTLTERRLSVASHVLLESVADPNLVERHDEFDVLQFTK